MTSPSPLPWEGWKDCTLTSTLASKVEVEVEGLRLVEQGWGDCTESASRCQNRKVSAKQKMTGKRKAQAQAEV